MLSPDLATLVLRVVIGLLFIGHGAQKLFGWFGGYGIQGTANYLGSLGLNPPKFWAFAAGLAEFLGGLGLILGLLTPVAAAAIIGVMLMAIVKVHWEHGVWVSNNGIEHALTNLLIVAFIALVQSGQYTLDTYLNLSYPMPTTFLIALAVAVVGVLIGLISGGGRMTETQPQKA